MSRFTQILSDADSRLTVPEPARSRILLEIAADMEDLRREYLARNVSEEEAVAAVVDHFDLSDEALRELVRVHDTPVKRSLDSLSGQVRGPWSRLLLIVFAFFVILVSGTLLLQGDLYRDSSRLIWVLLPLIAAGVVMAGTRGVRLIRAGDLWNPGLRSGLGRLLGLSVVILLVTGAGLWVELYLSALRIRGAPGEALIHLVGWLHMASATLVVSLSGALVLGFLWFFLEARVRQQESKAITGLFGEVS